jgi:DNA mismatch endonuclease (patch repair protein)
VWPPYRLEHVFDHDIVRHRQSGPSYRNGVSVIHGGATPIDAKPAAYVTSPGRSRNMAAIRRMDTTPEVVLRSALHRAGYRFRKDYPVRIDRKLIRPDIAFTRRRIAIFIDGCFWHSCPEHGRRPTVNSQYWLPKLKRNAERDRQQTDALATAGWTVLRFWEHESQEDVLRSIIEVLDRP